MTPQPEWDFEDHYDGAERHLRLQTRGSDWCGLAADFLLSWPHRFLLSWPHRMSECHHLDRCGLSSAPTRGIRICDGAELATYLAPLRRCARACYELV